MRKALAIVGQVIAYAAFALFIGWFSVRPSYQYASPDIAIIKLSLSHAAERVEPCVMLTPEQIAELPPNMRRPELCERERLPVVVELEVDGEVVFHKEQPPTGLWGDGPASIYAKQELQPGSYRITARLRDSHDNDGWDYEHTEDVQLQSGRYFTVTFRAETGGFRFR